jgi:arylsulfatase A-like enzyme/Flp pilus assembly protein TadD
MRFRGPRPWPLLWWGVTFPVALLTLACMQAHRSVVLVSLDTCRADRLGCYGYGSAATPTLDSLAASGALFLACYTTAPLTLPAHASLLTSELPPRHGVRDNGFYYLEDRATTVAEVLSSSGFRTGAVVGGYPVSAHYGLAQGFQVYDDRLPGGRPSGLELGYPERRADVVTDKALSILRRLSASSFFLWVHYFDPHAPYEPPSQWAQLPPYDGEIAYVDAQLSRLLAAVPARALVIVTADHGEGLGDHGEDTHGSFLHETTTRVPLIISGPGVSAGSVVRQVVSLIDVGPCILEWCGVPSPSGWQGATLWPLLKGETGSARPAYFETFHPWHRYGWSPKRGLRWGDVTYVVNSGETVVAPENGGTSPPLEHLRSMLAALCEQERFAPRPAGQQEVRFLQSLGYVDQPDQHHAKVLRLLERGDNALVEGRTSDATALYNDALTLDPGNPHALMASGIVRAETGDFGGAETLLGALVEQRPGDVAALENLAVVLFQLGRMKESEQLFRRVIEILPPNLTAREFLAEIRHQAGDYRGSVAYYEELCDLSPEEPRYHRDAGTVYAYDLAMPREALAHWREALRLDPTGPQSEAIWEEVSRLRGAGRGGDSGHDD